MVSDDCASAKVKRLVPAFFFISKQTLFMSHNLIIVAQTDDDYDTP